MTVLVYLVLRLHLYFFEILKLGILHYMKLVFIIQVDEQWVIN
jgi:hypothetical protein